MIHSYLLLCLFPFIHGIVASETIIGAEKAQTNQFPYQVSMQVIRGTNSCGGGIISDELILTAGHCVLNESGGFRQERLIIVAGTNDAHHIIRPAVAIEVHQIFVPTEFMVASVNSTSDIAILKLRESLKLSENRHMKKLKLPRNQRDDYAGHRAIIAGFGIDVVKMVNEQPFAMLSEPLLRYTAADVLSNARCQQDYVVRISDKHVCARVRQDHPYLRSSTCLGDSGGPLVFDGTVIGILSKGPYDCDETVMPALYTRVSHFLTFIHNVIKEKQTKYIRSYEHYYPQNS